LLLNIVSQVYYPKYITPELYKDVWTSEGYGGLFSIVLKDEASAKLFYDRISCFKGPSLGTNFTLACPYTILAHYNELDWATEYGVVPYLVRVSVGLENIEELKEIFLGALNSILDE
jgi:cystathionine gamma-synthase